VLFQAADFSKTCFSVHQKMPRSTAPTTVTWR
jgi:hypothetical protein